MLTAFIAGAKKELAIYDAKVQDPAIIKLLQERAAKGVTVRVIGKMKGKRSGHRRTACRRMRLHVRAIVRDGTAAFVGSQSLRKAELENRREVGLIVNNPGVARKIMQVFEADWLKTLSKSEVKEVKEAAENGKSDKDKSKEKEKEKEARETEKV